MEGGADWFARLLGIGAIIISAITLCLRIQQARKQRPVLEIKQSDIVMQEDFDEYCRKHNSDVVKSYSKYTFPALSVPVEIHLILRNRGSTPAPISGLDIGLESTPIHLADAFRLFILEKLGRRGRTLGDILRIGDEQPLYLKPDQSPMKLPFTIESGRLIDCRGVVYLDLRITDSVFQNYKLHRSELNTPLDLTNFVLEARGFSSKKASFRLKAFSGGSVICNTIFNPNEYWAGYWSCL
jgi:hypothetical protein